MTGKNTDQHLDREILEKKQQLQSYYSEIAASDPYAPQGGDNFYVDQARQEDEERERRGGSRYGGSNSMKYDPKQMLKEKMQQQQDMIKESMMTEQQKNAKLVEEVLTSKEHEQEKKIKEIEHEVLSELQKCSLHPKNIFQNKNCRHCKKIREEFEVRKNQKLEEIQNNQKGEVAGNKELTVSEMISANGLFPTSCDYKNGNLPEMIRNTILSCQYFKDLYNLKTFKEVIEEIKTHVSYTEPWIVGANGVPSTLFCCLYKFMLMRLNEKQVQTLLRYKLSPYVRACGALYVRFLSPNDQLFDRLSPYMLDEQSFSYSIEKSQSLTFGEYVERLLSEKNYFSILLPRIPVIQFRELQKKLLTIPEKRKRKQDNLENSNKFNKGQIVFALSKKDQSWHKAKISGIHYESSAPIQKKPVENYGIEEDFFNEEEGENFDNEYDEDEQDVRAIRKLQVMFIEGPFTKDEEVQEFIGLEDVLLISRNEEGGQKHRKRSQSNDSWGDDSDAQQSRKAERKRSRSRDRDGDFKTPFDRNENQDDKLMEEVLRRERDQAAASRKEDYSKRPASYKSALSLALPVGTTRKKDSERKNSPERKLVHVENPAAYKEEKRDPSKQLSKDEQFERMKKIQEKYGDASALINLTHVFDCYESFAKEYKDKHLINEEEFDDIFSPLLNDTQIYYNKLQSNGNADFYEAFVALSLFSKGEFDRKIKGIYLAFDQDNSGSIDRKELLMFLYNGIFGLCKLLGLPIPRRDDVQQYAYNIFKIIDINKNDCIEYSEFAFWIKESDEIQDFLLKYTGQQTFERARKRYKGLLDYQQQLFDEIAIDFMGEKVILKIFITLNQQYATMVELKQVLLKAMKQIQPHILEKLFLILDYDNKGAVSEFEFNTVMKPWASFSATDINNDNELDSMELKTLIWLIDEEEPLESRVQRDLKLMDRDGSGTIDRLEWIQFLASPDPTTGIEIFDFNLKKAFDTHDADKSGSIDLEELGDLLMENFEDLIKGKSDENRQIISKLIQSLARDLMQALDTRKEGVLDWSQFKNYSVVAKDKEEKIKDFIRKFA
eukprot:403345272